MRKCLVFAALAALASSAAFAGPFDQFKGKMKPGLYEVKMNMEMPGMPAGMGKQAMTMENCVTEKDIEQGQLGKNDQKQSGCDVKDMKVSGNTATYKMVCKDPPMTTDAKITWRDNGYVMDMKTDMNHGGQAMRMTNHMEGTYKGPCKK